jgi:hypothetical protein
MKPATRRERLAAIGREDARNRCAWCRINLLTVDGPIVVTLEGRRFCSDGCFESSQQWDAFQEEKRLAK